MNIRQAAVLFVIFSLMVLTPAFSQDRIGGNFVLGLNLAWFDGDYGHDLGPSHPEGWKPSFTEEKCRKYFKEVSSMGCRVVRVWAFERQEGLVFDSKDRLVTGLDPLFLKNCDSLMKIAQENRLFIYWTLLNHLIVEDEGGKHMSLLRVPEEGRSYNENAVVPFLKRYGNHPAFWAVDLMNEAEGAIGGIDALSGAYDPRKGCTWKTMRAFLKETITAVRREVPKIKISSSSGWHEYKNLDKFSGLGLDFLDWHSYRDDADIPDRSKLGNRGIPIIIGECGPKDKGKNDQLQKRNWEAYLYGAYKKGYAGILPWSYGKPGGNDNFNLVNADGSWRPATQALINFARGYGDIGPTFPSDRNQTLLSAIEDSMSEFFNLGPGSNAKSSWARLYWYLKKGFPYANPDYALTRLDFCCSALYSSYRSLLRKGDSTKNRRKHLSFLARKILTKIVNSSDPGRREILERHSVKVLLKSVAYGQDTEILSGAFIKKSTSAATTGKKVSGSTNNPFAE